MKDWPWKHIVITASGFIAGYALTQMAEGYNDVAFHWSWHAILIGLSMSGLYTAGLVQELPPARS